jgi:chemotaxis protein histidine kinase CheA
MAAHTLKGLVATFAAEPARQILADMEKSDPAHSGALLDALKHEMDLFLMALKAWVTDHPQKRQGEA